MTDSLRSHIHEAGTILSRSLGTFVGLGWIVFVSSVVAVRAVELPIADDVVPVELYWTGAFVVAAILTVWLVDSGYERLGADPAGVWTFVWLAVVLVPLAFFPTRVALEAVSFSSPLLDAGFVFATTAGSGWLAFYNGLEQLDLAVEDLIRVLASVLILGAMPLGAVVVFEASWLTEPPVMVIVAVGVQMAACWLGLRTDSLFTRLRVRDTPR